MMSVCICLRIQKPCSLIYGLKCHHTLTKRHIASEQLFSYAYTCKLKPPDDMYEVASAHYTRRL